MLKIVVRADYQNGNPAIENRRLTVLDVVSDCYYDGIDCFLENFPDFSRADVIQVLDYCRNRKCDVDGGHCGGCSLRLADDGINSITDFINRFSKVIFVEEPDDFITGEGEGVMIMPGKKTDLSENWRGLNGWELAEKLFSKHKTH